MSPHPPAPLQRTHRGTPTCCFPGGTLQSVWVKAGILSFNFPLTNKNSLPFVLLGLQSQKRPREFVPVKAAQPRGSSCIYVMAGLVTFPLCGLCCVVLWGCSEVHAPPEPGARSPTAKQVERRRPLALQSGSTLKCLPVSVICFWKVVDSLLNARSDVFVLLINPLSCRLTFNTPDTSAQFAPPWFL